MTDQEFWRAMIGQGADYVGSGPGQTRLRYVVADGFTKLGKELRSEGRPDRASLCSHIASKLEHGEAPTKKVASKASREIETVKYRLVDDIPIVTIQVNR